MQITKLTESFAAEIDGANDQGKLSDADFAEIEEAFLTHQVIVMRNQDLSPDDQKDDS